MAPLSGRKPALFLLTRLVVITPKTGFDEPNLAGGHGSKMKQLKSDVLGYPGITHSM